MHIIGNLLQALVLVLDYEFAYDPGLCFDEGVIFVWLMNHNETFINLYI